MKFCVIGLGRFGYHVAKVLSDNGMEVLAIDSNESIVASIRNQVTQAICMRVTDETSLQSIGIEEMDTVVVATGENFAQSILITALLKKRLNIPHVIARAINEIHKEILQIIGADRCILPEKEIGIRLANSLSSPLAELTHLSKHFAVSLLPTPKKFIGKRIEELNLFGHYSVQCIGRKQKDAKDTIVAVAPSYVIEADDKLLFAGDINHLEAVARL